MEDTKEGVFNEEGMFNEEGIDIRKIAANTSRLEKRFKERERERERLRPFFFRAGLRLRLPLFERLRSRRAFGGAPAPSPLAGPSPF